MRNLLILMCAVFSVGAQSGQDSGGGTSVAAEFVFVGREALGILTVELPELNLSSAEQILKNTEVFAVNSICYTLPSGGDQVCRDAEYNPIEQKIRFDQNKWSQATCIEKFVISSHEYLRAGGVEDANYFYSSLFYGAEMGKTISKAGRDIIFRVCNYLELEKERRRDASSRRGDSK